MTNPLVFDLLDVKNILSDIDWSFSTSFSVGRSGVSLFDVRKYHWYPATFVPEIPFTLIDVLTKPGAKIFDPFAGVGTTIFQSLLLGREPFGTEISTIAVNLIRAYWTLLKANSDINKMGESLKNMVREYKPDYVYKVDMSSTSVDIESLRLWYNKKTFNELLFLITHENSFNDDGSKAAYWVSLSATLKAVCARDNGFGCISDNMLPSNKQLSKEKNALRRFQNNFLLLAREFAKLKSRLPLFSKDLLEKSSCDDHVFHQDIRQFTKLEDEEIDLVITSPPYPNMTDYSYSQRLSYYLLGQQPENDVKYEIGARRNRNKKNALEQYDESMKKAIDVISRKLKYGGYACFVLPYFSMDGNNNIDRRALIDKCLAHISNRNLSKEYEFTRILPERRRQHNQFWANLKKERILLFRK
jgi:DNA modification methylase